jgi:signal transduction histidine kinase
MEMAMISKINDVLINIANSLQKTKNVRELFFHIQQHLSVIIDTKNFYIALYEKEEEMIELLYIDDEKDNFERFPIGKTLTGYVIRTGKTLFADADFHRRMIEKGELILLGAPAEIWLGVPLKIEDEVIGAMVVQSYEDKNLYNENDKDILEMVSGLIAIVIARKKAEDNLHQLNLELERRIDERTAKLQQSLETLQETQNQLVQSGKMAALGNLVAGVAHEINTPVGIGVTAASHLMEKTETILSKYKKKTLKRSELEEYFDTSINSTQMILSNLKHASENIRSFKQVAVDQTKDEKRLFNVKQYIEEILLSLHPRLKKTAIQVDLSCSEDLEIYSYPGALSQLLTNLIINSLNHAFNNALVGTIAIEIKQENKFLNIRYEDDGCGISEDNRKKIFDPFFTTNRSKGGTGLGLHVVYNLVNHKLNGSIQCESEEGEYSRFMIEFPIEEVINHEE